MLMLKLMLLINSRLTGTVFLQ